MASTTRAPKAITTFPVRSFDPGIAHFRQSIGYQDLQSNAAVLISATCGRHHGILLRTQLFPVAPGGRACHRWGPALMRTAKHGPWSKENVCSCAKKVRGKNTDTPQNGRGSSQVTFRIGIYRQLCWFGGLIETYYVRMFQRSQPHHSRWHPSFFLVVP